MVWNGGASEVFRFGKEPTMLFAKFEQDMID